VERRLLSAALAFVLELTFVDCRSPPNQLHWF